MPIVNKCFIALCLGLVWSGCSNGLRQGRKVMPYLSKGKDTIRLSSRQNPDTVKVHYIGTGGVYIQKGQKAVLVDPFFSNPGPLLANFFRRRLPFDSIAIRHYFAQTLDAPKDTQGNIKALLISHAHYDHIMDVPFLWHEGLIHQDSIRLIGSKTTGHYLSGAGVNTTKIQVIKKEEATNHQQIGKYYTLGQGSIRVYPVVNAHAPHIRIFGIPIKLASGKASKDKFPRRLGGFKEGQTYSFLIDFLNDAEVIDFRVFVQTSSSKAPYGFMPAALRNQRPIDLAVLGVASFKQVKKYPEDLLLHLQPRHVLWVHWENFFRSLNSLKQKPRVVRNNFV